MSADTGIQTAFDVDAYADAAAALLADRDRLARMSRAAVASAATLSLQQMVDQFTAGIVQCLEGPR